MLDWKPRKHNCKRVWIRLIEHRVSRVKKVEQLLKSCLIYMIKREEEGGKRKWGIKGAHYQETESCCLKVMILCQVYGPMPISRPWLTEGNTKFLEQRNQQNHIKNVWPMPCGISTVALVSLTFTYGHMECNLISPDDRGEKGYRANGGNLASTPRCLGVGGL